MTDISMSIDETLELDAIIEEWSGSDSIVDLNGDGSSFNVSGIQTKTSILDPQETGNYTITINGQDLSVEVTDTSTIPDSGDLKVRYDWSDSSTTTSKVPDLTGNGFNLNGGFTSLNTSINGVQTGEFGDDDMVSNQFPSSVSQPYTVFFVAEFVEAINSFSVATSGYSNRVRIYNGNGSDESGINAGIYLTSDDPTTNDPTIYSAVYDGTNSLVRINGSETTGNAGTNSIDGVTVGEDSDGAYGWNGNVGEYLLYPSDKSGTISDIESYLSDKWGITI